MISRSVLLRMRNASDRSCTENQHTLCVPELFSENRAVYEITWRNTAVTATPQMAISYGAENTRFACRVTKARIQTFTQNMKYLLLFPGDNDCVKAPWCYGTRTVHSSIKHRTKGAKSFFTFLFGATFFCKRVTTCPRTAIILQAVTVRFLRNPKVPCRNRRNLSRPVKTRTRGRGGPAWRLPPGAKLLTCLQRPHVQGRPRSRCAARAATRHDYIRRCSHVVARLPQTFQYRWRRQFDTRSLVRAKRDRRHAGRHSPAAATTALLPVAHRTQCLQQQAYSSPSL
jgi:hypothetical protein